MAADNLLEVFFSWKLTIFCQCPDYYPKLVRLDLIPDVPPVEFPSYDVFPLRPEWVPASGVLSSAKAATAEKGSMMANHISRGIAAAIGQEFQTGAAIAAFQGVAALR